MNYKTYDEIDRIFFDLEIRLGKLCDKKSKVKFRDVYEEITKARVDLAKLHKRS